MAYGSAIVTRVLVTLEIREDAKEGASASYLREYVLTPLNPLRSEILRSFRSKDCQPKTKAALNLHYNGLLMCVKT